MTEAPSALDVVDARAAAVARAPRITKAQIEENIVDTIYATADQLITDELAVNAADKKEAYDHLTICMIRVNNGFIVIGKSAPMRKDNFNADLGKQLAYEDAFHQLWPLYAFASLEDDWLYDDRE